VQIGEISAKLIALNQFKTCKFMKLNFIGWKSLNHKFDDSKFIQFKYSLSTYFRFHFYLTSVSVQK